MLQEEFYTLIAIIYSITQIDNGSTNPNPNPLTLNPTSFRYFDYQMKRQKRVEKLLWPKQLKANPYFPSHKNYKYTL